MVQWLVLNVLVPRGVPGCLHCHLSAWFPPFLSPPASPSHPPPSPPSESSSRSLKRSTFHPKQAWKQRKGKVVSFSFLDCGWPNSTAQDHKAPHLPSLCEPFAPRRGPWYYSWAKCAPAFVA